jgi:hypothetical protein
VPEKVQGYHDLVEALEDDAERLRERAKLFREQAEIQARKADRIEQKLRYTMRATNFERLPGIDFNAVRGTRRHLVIQKPVLEAADFIRFPAFIQPRYQWARAEPTAEIRHRYPELVETRYEWDKDALRAAFKSGTAPADLVGYAIYDEQETFSWQVRKKL